MLLWICFRRQDSDFDLFPRDTKAAKALVRRLAELPWHCGRPAAFCTFFNRFGSMYSCQTSVVISYRHELQMHACFAVNSPEETHSSTGIRAAQQLDYARTGCQQDLPIPKSTLDYALTLGTFCRSE